MMKTTIHNKHPAFLKLQDAKALWDKLQETSSMAYRKSNGGIVQCANTLQYLQAMLSDFDRGKSYQLNGWCINSCDLLSWDYRLSDIIVAVENFDTVELEAYDLTAVIGMLLQYERTLYVMEQEGL